MTRSDHLILDVGAVAEAIREAEAAEIAPRFRRLAEGEVEEKSPGEVVTAADRACEVLLTRRLTAIVDVAVIGEEAVSADPRVLDALGPESTCWLVDPLDGTSNFVAGSPDYAVMVAYVRHGVTVASWIWVPATESMFIAELGAGAACNGERLMCAQPSFVPDALSGVIKERFLPDDVRRRLGTRASSLAATLAGRNCAGIDYPLIVSADIDFILYWRTLPWDHAPGVLLATEAGCTGLRPDGSAYEPHSQQSGLLVAPTSIARELLEHLFGEEAPRPGYGNH